MIRMVMENAGLALWPVLSLLIFGGALVAMILWVYRSGSEELYSRLGALAADDAGLGASARKMNSPKG